MKSILQRYEQGGTDALSDRDLLSLVLGDEQAAYKVMEKSSNSLLKMATFYGYELRDCLTIRKRATLQAFLELNKRKSIEQIKSRTVATSADVRECFKELIGDSTHEVFLVMYLNRANKVLCISTLSEGGMTGTVADPRMILKQALDVKAISIVVCHNHPSGSLSPSRQDEDLTSKIKQACSFFDIRLLDHLIVSQDGYYSFCDEGIL